MDKLILCFETGGTKLVVSMFDWQGNVVAGKVIQRKQGQNARETVDCLCREGRKIAREFGSPVALGWGFGGTVDRLSGNPVYCYHEDGWGEFEAVSWLSREFNDIPVFVENDCNLAALAEAWAEGGDPPEMLFFATLGTGIGGGIIHKGRLQQFSREGEGEIGHLVVDPSGPRCPCGNRGCLETFCSGPGLANLALKLTGKSMDSREVMRKFFNDDPEALMIINQAAEYLAPAFAAVINILAPDEIVLGGGLMWNNEKFLDLIRKKSLGLSFPVLSEKVRFRLSGQGEDLVCRGAYLFVRQELPGLQK